MTLKQIVELGLQILNGYHIDAGLFFCWVLRFQQRLHLCMSFHNICPLIIYTKHYFLVFELDREFGPSTHMKQAKDSLDGLYMDLLDRLEKYGPCWWIL